MKITDALTWVRQQTEIMMGIYLITNCIIMELCVICFAIDLIAKLFSALLHLLSKFVIVSFIIYQGLPILPVLTYCLAILRSFLFPQFALIVSSMNWRVTWVSVLVYFRLDQRVIEAWFPLFLLCRQ